MSLTEKIRFAGSDGQLAARLDRPAGSIRAYAIFAHCFTCGANLAVGSRIARALARRGIATLRFDFTGLGGSDGDFANTNFSSNLEDLEAAARFLREHHRAPQLLIGHSLGGAAVLAVAERIAEVEAVATIGAPADPVHLTGLLGEDALAEIGERGVASVSIGGRGFQIKRQFLDDLDRQRQDERLGRLGKPVALFHSPVDEIVPIDEAARIYRRLEHPKSFVSLDRADHLLSNKADAEYVAEVLSAWAGRYLSLPAPEAEPEGQVVVEEQSGGRFLQAVRVGSHVLSADEPRAAGGNDEGPSPYDFLLIALGACTSMTLRMYADHKGLPLEHVAVTLDHEKIHARDCEDCEKSSSKIDRIRRRLRISGELSDAQRTRLVEIADRCPVHRTLEGDIRIETSAD